MALNDIFTKRQCLYCLLVPIKQGYFTHINKLYLDDMDLLCIKKQENVMHASVFNDVVGRFP